MRYSYHTEQWLPYPVERVFTFFANPDNLPLLMPRWQKARIDEAILRPPPTLILTSASSREAGAGSQVTLSFLPFPFAPARIRWTSEIIEFSRNSHFCDQQMSGPFAYWKHCHYLRPSNRDGLDVTLIEDDVEYELPFGALTGLAHRFFLRRQIERAFAYRQSQLTKILAA
jgi:ligand-binding SRPBCC domain-containing protein